MTRFRDQPIGRKVTLLLWLASAVVLTLSGAGVLFYEVTTVQPRVLRDLGAEANLLRANTAAALSFEDRRAARENLATLRAKPEIAAAALYGATGTPFAEYLRQPAKLEVPGEVPAVGVVTQGPLIALTQPVRGEDELVGYLALWYELPPLTARLPQYGILAVVVAGALLTVATLMSWLLRTQLSAPLLALADTARAVTDRGDYGVRAAKHGDDEIGELTDAFNAMLATIQARDVALQRSAEQLYQSQKMEAIGRLAGGIAHDFNNLLTAILGYARFARESMPEGMRARQDVEQIEEAGTRAAALTAQLLAYARRQMIAPRTTDLNAVVTGMEGLLRRLLGEDVMLETRLDPALWPVTVDPSQLEQVILNLAVNARDAMPKGGTLSLETHNVALDGDYAALVVRDTGSGMDEATRSHLFEPFFTTKEQGRGTGLGLAVCYGIVRQADGHISVETALGAGSTFTVYLPREVGPGAIRPARVNVPMSDPTGNETILVVEDEPAVRNLAVRALRGLGYTVLEAEDGPAAIRLAEAYPAPVHLLLVDVVMPNLSGKDVADQIVAARPGVRVIYMSGYTEHPAIRQDMARDREFIAKPFDPARLAHVVRAALDENHAVSVSPPYVGEARR